MGFVLKIIPEILLYLTRTVFCKWEKGKKEVTVNIVLVEAEFAGVRGGFLENHHHLVP